MIKMRLPFERPFGKEFKSDAIRCVSLAAVPGLLEFVA